MVFLEDALRAVGSPGDEARAAHNVIPQPCVVEPVRPAAAGGHYVSFGRPRCGLFLILQPADILIVKDKGASLPLRP